MKELENNTKITTLEGANGKPPFGGLGGFAIEAHNLTVVYNKKPAIWNVDFTLPEKKIIGIMGPNGSGKSTLLKAMLGLIKPEQGWVKIYGKPGKESAKKIGYIPQRQSIDWDFPATVEDVVRMGRFPHKGLFGRFTKSDKEIIDEAIERTNLQELRHRQISQLSGGQQQRTFIARALAQQPEILIMDEPFAGVDATTEEAIVTLLREMRNEGKTILVVHHDLVSAADYFDWLVLLNTRLVGFGPMETMYNETMISQAFGGKPTILSKMNLAVRGKTTKI